MTHTHSHTHRHPVLTHVSLKGFTDVISLESVNTFRSLVPVIDKEKG